MKLTKIICEPRAEVSFTKAEAEYMVRRTRGHYDAICQQAGLAVGESGARENGFIRQLTLFDRRRGVVWDGRKIDLALKVIEAITKDQQTPMQLKLTKQLTDTYKELQRKYDEVNS